eukprot:scaffold74026_cov27-Tisochrysis_lutea.AAC.1
MMCAAAPLSVDASSTRWASSPKSSRSASPRWTMVVIASPFCAALERRISSWRMTRAFAVGSASKSEASVV